MTTRITRHFPPPPEDNDPAKGRVVIYKARAHDSGGLTFISDKCGDAEVTPLPATAATEDVQDTRTTAGHRDAAWGAWAGMSALCIALIATMGGVGITVSCIIIMVYGWGYDQRRSMTARVSADLRLWFWRAIIEQGWRERRTRDGKGAPRG